LGGQIIYFIYKNCQTPLPSIFELVKQRSPFDPSSSKVMLTYDKDKKKCTAINALALEQTIL
jgi:hypothetical protein